jgi:mRNA interferase RelE/StbE
VNYSIRIRASAAKDLTRIDKPDRQRIAAEIDALGGQPHKGSQLKGDLRGLRRIRVGDYRIVYEVLDHELIVLIIRVSRRREGYR